MREKRERWGRLLITRRSYTNQTGTRVREIGIRVVTFPVREFTTKRVGSAPLSDRYLHPSAVMDLGEAVQTAIDRGLPLLLSTEAAGRAVGHASASGG